ncbi:YgdI/YgdR family lipoprotein [Ewingella sp. S1.OA.A_B6]
MKTGYLLASAVILSTLLAGCSSNYAIQTNDGRTIVSEGKPKIDRDTGLIKYKDAWGKQRQIAQTDVKVMSELGK